MYWRDEPDPFLCKWNVSHTNVTLSAALSKDITAETLVIEGLDLQSPSSKHSGKNYIKIVGGRTISNTIRRPLKIKDDSPTEYMFDYEYNLKNRADLLSYISLRSTLK
jgi:hypothetical protein